MPPASSPGLLALLVLAAAWVWGSFLNQVVDRTPRSLPPPAAPSDAAAEGRPTLLHPARSVCLACSAPIPWYDNIPVVAYLRLRGRCRACGAAIGRRTLVLEALTPLLLLTWHLTARLHALPPATELWGHAAASWLLVAVPVGVERRRFHPLFLALGVVAWGGWVVTLVGAGT